MKKDKQSVTVFIPVTNLDAIWKGDFSRLPANKTYDLIIDYPLTTPAHFKIKTGRKGIGLIKLLHKIGQAYQKVYEKEDATLRSEEEGGCYGIWGHSIEDLSLEGINVNHVTRKITLDIGS